MTTRGDDPTQLKFTEDQRLILGRLLVGPRKADVMLYLYDHYKIRLTQEIHDSATVEVPTSVTATAASVIVTELQALFG